jgi:hypothetical protein
VSPTRGCVAGSEAFRDRGRQHVDLTWTGAGGAHVRVLRSGTEVTTTANDAYTDAIGLSGGGSYSYQVCPVDGGSCSNSVVVTF